MPRALRRPTEEQSSIFSGPPPVVTVLATVEPLKHARAARNALTGAVVSSTGMVRDHNGGWVANSVNCSFRSPAGAAMERSARWGVEELPGVRIWAVRRGGGPQAEDTAIEAAAIAEMEKVQKIDPPPSSEQTKLGGVNCTAVHGYDDAQVLDLAGVAVSEAPMLPTLVPSVCSSSRTSTNRRTHRPGDPKGTEPT